MRPLDVSQRFKKNLKSFLQKHPELRTTFQERVSLLQADPSAPQLQTHKLTGKLKGSFALSITYEYRLVFALNDSAIYLLAVGTHDEVH